MRISVFGLGYVGAVSTACLARDGHEIVGVDVNPEKVGIINSGRSPIVEKDLEPLLAEGVKAGRIHCTTDSGEAVAGTEVSIVCVSTPSNTNGSIDLRYIERVCQQIGTALKAKTSRHLVVIRSTVLPGTCRAKVIPTLEGSSGKKAGQDFGVLFHPELLRESTAIQDYDHPPKIVIGADAEADAEKIATLYEKIEGPLIWTDLETAEMVKYSDNVFHALKVVFANEIGRFCKASGIDSHKVMDIFCHDTKLNLSPYYLKPGFAFGGSCLPKDLRAVLHQARDLDVKMPLLESLFPSNELHVRETLKRIEALGKRKIGVLGLAFKQGTDDLRESPQVELVETLLGKGYEIRIYDHQVSLAKVFGANKEYIEKHIPHLSKLMVPDLKEVTGFAEVVIIGNRSEEFKAALAGLRKDQTVLDLVRIAEASDTQARYDGLCW